MTVIVQVVQHLNPGGIETLVLDLASFTEKEDQVYIVSLEGTINESLNHWPRLRLHVDRLIFLDKKPGFQFNLFMQLRTLFIDLKAESIHTHHIGPLIYGGLAARMSGIKSLIHTEHDAWHLSDKKHQRLQNIALSIVKPLFVADAKTVANNVKTTLGKEIDKVILNGIDTQYFRPGTQTSARRTLDLPQMVRIIGCSGRLEPVKGHKVLLEALTELPANVHLALAGCGSEEEQLKAQVHDLNITDRVHFMGRLDTMPAFYQCLNVFCLPSYNEGMPLSILEAQACGIPAVVTDVGGSYEALCPETGKLVPSGDARALASALMDSLAIRKDTNPREFVEANADVRLMAQSYAELRHRVLH